MFSKPTRNHITIVLEQIGAVGVIILTFAYSALYEAFSSGYNIFSKGFWLRLASGLVGYQSETVLVIIGVVVLLILLVPLWMLLRWYKTCFYIDGDYLVYEANTLLKKNSRLPLSSISTVNLERNIFERMVGTAKIKLDINSAATASQTDFTFVLSLDKAKVFEAELIKAKADKTVHESKERETVYSFSNSQAVRHVLLSQPVVQYFGLGALMVLGILLDREVFGGQMFMQLSSLLGISALGWAAKVAVQIMSACQFKIERDEKSIFISSGLLKKKSYSFETDKINALAVRRPVLARLFGYSYAEVAVIGLGNDKKETPQISLLIKEEELKKILSVCAADFECCGETVKEHRAGLVPTLFEYIAIFGCIGAAAAFIKWWLCPIIILSGAVFAVLSHKARSIAADENIFSYSQGFLSQKSCFFKYGDIQTVGQHTNSFMKRFDVCRIRLSILSHSSMSLHTTAWIPTALFEQTWQKVTK